MLLQQWDCLAAMSRRICKIVQRDTAHRYGVDFILKMPDCICDVKALKRTLAQNKQIVMQAEERIKLSVYNLKNGTPTKDGLGFLCILQGF